MIISNVLDFVAQLFNYHYLNNVAIVLKNSKHRMFLFAQSFITHRCLPNGLNSTKQCVYKRFILHGQPFSLPRKPLTFENGM